MIVDSKAIYRAFSETEDLPLFVQPWWLDIVAGEDGWGVALAFDGEKVVGSWPYLVPIRKLSVEISAMPLLTAHLGPRLISSNKRSGSQLSETKKIINKLVDDLPEFGHFLQFCGPDFDYWSPLFWRGFSAKPFYTFRLYDIGDGNQTWDYFQKSKRYEIRSAQKASITVEQTKNAQDLIEMIEMTFKRQGRRSPQDPKVLKQILEHSQHCDKVTQLTARDERGQIHACALFVDDAKCSYYLTSGSDPELRKSNALSLIIWEAIKIAGQKGLAFDFEGSMMEDIEAYFLGFNPVPVQYYSIWQTRSKRWGLLSAIKDMRK